MYGIEVMRASVFNAIDFHNKVSVDLSCVGWGSGSGEISC